MNFQHFKHAVAASFKKITEKSDIVLRTKATKDGMWSAYIAAYPEGSNPIFRERTEHDCNCCKSFVRSVGNVVGLIDGKLVSIWDITDIPMESHAYAIVADSMSKYVKSFEIETVFLSTEPSAGTEKTFRDVVDGGPVSWDHFFVKIPKQFVVRGTEIGPKISEINADFQVLKRSLDEITIDSTETVLELIEQNSIYRGVEHKYSVVQFNKLQRKYVKQKTESEKTLFVWGLLKNDVSSSVKRIRNTAIGSLLVDLSNDVDLETAVSAFERMVAPSNYKRPASLVTEKMVTDAKNTIETLGLTSSLLRRRASIMDIDVNNILFVDRSVGDVNETEIDDVFGEISKKSTKPKKFDKVEELGIEQFIKNVLPNAKKIEVFMENKHSKNLVSLLTAQNPTSQSIFKWGNNFSWSYTGNLADSNIKELVKNAGGVVDADVCCRLAWFNTDDLDLHMKEPGGYEIFFGNKGRLSPCGGMLDVDMNAFGGLTRSPVENIFYKDKSKMREGKYELFVQNFNHRESDNFGFVVEVDILGEKFTIEHNTPVRERANVSVLTFNYSRKNGIEILGQIPGSSVKREVWNVPTGNFVPVRMMALSPNFWEGEVGVGNKHYFFMLDGCVSDEKARAFFNEQLSDQFQKHRKVFEILGGKLEVQDVEEELSGIGFSETQRNELIVRVTGSFARVIKIKF